MNKFHETVADLKFAAVSIGFPSVVRDGKIVKEPKHLSKGWIGFNFGRVVKKPVRVINDAAMQALGSHVRGRMLFLGLGTGLGAALVWSNNLMPLELGDLPYREHRKIEDWLGKDGLEELGEKAWRKEVIYCVKQLKLSFVADTVVLGGGNVKKMARLPRGVKRGDNRNAFLAVVVCGKPIEEPANLAGEFYSVFGGLSERSTSSDFLRNLISEVGRKVAAITRLKFWSLPVFAG